MKEKFIQEINARYNYSGEKLVLGKGMLDKQVVPETEISIPLKMINRHGLIAGATGTGKTKSLQILAEQLSLKGIPSLMMDIKGDLSGLATAGEPNNKIKERHQLLNIPYQSKAFPVELLTISDEKGVKLRSTVTEFGPILFSKILGLNDTQQSIMSIIFKYCDDKALPIIDLKDLRKVLQYVTENPKGKAELHENYGAIAPSSLGAILRSIVALEQQGADKFFGEPSFDPHDLLQTRDGLGVINIVRLVDLQSKPNLFSTFMLSLLAEIYNTFPEEGDSDKPKLAIFIDEAHLVFNEASKVLLNQIETVIKLIRSKGVGVFFITQIPGDVPDAVLSQLGLKIQHALRGFTAKDKKEITKAVENYPITEYYQVDNLIQELGIGETFITTLDEKGIPTPLVHAYMVAPMSRMDILTDHEIDDVITNSALYETYSQDIDKETAYEILSQNIQQAQGNTTESKTTTSQEKEEPSVFESMINSSAGKQLQRSLIREGTNLLFGMLGLKRRR